MYYGSDNMIMVMCPKCGQQYELGKKHACKLNKHMKKLNNNFDSQADKIIHSKEWKKLRRQILERDHFLCQRCLKKYNYYNADNLTVHHIIARIHDPEMGFNPKNLVTLCRTCNNQLGVQDKLDFNWNAEEANKNFENREGVLTWLVEKENPQH